MEIKKITQDLVKKFTYFVEQRDVKYKTMKRWSLGKEGYARINFSTCQNERKIKF